MCKGSLSLCIVEDKYKYKGIDKGLVHIQNREYKQTSCFKIGISEMQ